MSKIEIIYKKVDDLIPYINNPRKNDAGVDAVASSIMNFGFKVPMLIDPENEIINGHTRLKAAKKLGMEEVPCIIATDLNDAQIKAYRLADNKVAEFSEWDYELLENELEELMMADFSEDFFNDMKYNFDMDKVADTFNNFEDIVENQKDKDNKVIICPHCGETIKVSEL